MGLKIAMQDPIRVTKAYTGKNLSQKRSHRWNRQTNSIIDVIGRLMFVHKCLQVVCYKLKDEIKTARVGLNDIQQLDDIRMIKFSQEGNFSNNVAWDSSFWS